MGQPRKIILKDTVFNDLKFIEEIPTEEKQVRVGIFQCICGNINKYRISSVRNNAVKRCKSCLNRLNAEGSRKYFLNNIFKDGFENPDNSYILGLFFADGTVRNVGNTISISLVEDDVLILEQIKNLIQPDKPLHYCSVNGGRNQYRLSISDVDIKNAFVDAGCVLNKSLILNYPLVKVSHRDFIRGYIDGDGHVSRKQFSIMGTREFLESVHKEFEKVTNKQIQVRWYQKNKEVNNWSIAVSFLEDRFLLLEWLYEDCNLKLERKYKTYIEKYKNMKKGSDEWIGDLITI